MTFTVIGDIIALNQRDTWHKMEDNWSWEEKLLGRSVFPASTLGQPGHLDDDDCEDYDHYGHHVYCLWSRSRMWRLWWPSCHMNSNSIAVELWGQSSESRPMINVVLPHWAFSIQRRWCPRLQLHGGSLPVDFLWEIVTIFLIIWRILCYIYVM